MIHIRRILRFVFGVCPISHSLEIRQCIETKTHDKLNLDLDPFLFFLSPVPLRLSVIFRQYGILAMAYCSMFILHSVQYVLIKSIDISGKLNCVERISEQ